MSLAIGSYLLPAASFTTSRMSPTARDLAVLVAILVGLSVIALALAAPGPLTPESPSPSPPTSPSPPQHDPASPDGDSAGDGTRQDDRAPETETPDGPFDGRAPPGVSANGIEDEEVLLANHTETLVRSGFVSAVDGAATVERYGLLVDATVRAGSRVERNATAYRYWNETETALFERRTEAWSNGSVEYRRQTGTDQEGYARGDPQSPRRLAGVWLLRSHLRAGNYTVTNVTERDGTTLFTLRATSIDDGTAARRALPEGGTNVSAYDATVVVDRAGRVRLVRVRQRYEVGGTTAPYRFTYELGQIGGVTVDRPAWVDEAEAS